MKRRDTILVVDDLEVNRAILCSLFEEEYKLLEAANGVEALEIIERAGDSIAVILLDIVMPQMDGYQVLRVMSEKRLLENIPVVVITSEGSAESELQAFDYGASDIVTKPFEPHLVLRRVKNIIELYRHKLHLEDMVEDQAAKLRESNEVLTDALSSVIEYRSMESGQHIRRIRLFTRELLQVVAEAVPEYNLDPHTISVIASASSMHDIGKIAISDAILNKPGRLTPEEFEIMKTHTTKGCEILSTLERMEDQEYLQYAYDICRYHHERWDGRGYPDGLCGDEIPVYAQIVGIADCYDALTTNRVYKAAFPHDKAAEMILNGECGVFSPQLLECFCTVRERFSKLASECADGLAVKKMVSEGSYQLRVHAPLEDNRLLRQKYEALLRCTSIAVQEIDWSTSRIRALRSSKDFETLSDGPMKDSLAAFVQSSIHPGDRERFLKDLKSQGAFLKFGGDWNIEGDYRVFHAETRTYWWYHLASAEIGLNTTVQSSCLLVWEVLPKLFPLEKINAGGQIAKGYHFLADGIPGGLLQCTAEAPQEIILVNEGFLSMFGYTRDELREKFHNHFSEMIDPRDRQRALGEAHKQIELGRPHNLEYRILHKGNESMWVMDIGQVVPAEDGSSTYCSLLINISENKKIKEELRITLERYQIILNQTNDIVFEWDIKEDTFEFSPNWEVKFGYAPMTKAVSKRVHTDSHIHKDDQDAFIMVLERIRSGAPYCEVEVRMKTTVVSYVWYKVKMTTLYDDSGFPVKAVGLFMDIDREKKQTQELLERAQRDTLTKLFNKGTSQKMIEQYLDSKCMDRMAAVLIVDIDDFKMVNDTMGHLFGDTLLVSIARAIEGKFRQDDIVGRIGGDEFIVCIKDISNVGTAEVKANQILLALEDATSVKGMSRKVSCSIGIAISPISGQSFEELYQKADLALYQAKRLGKNQAVLFDETAMADAPELAPRKVQSTVNTAIDSDEIQKNFNTQLIEYIFRVLSRAVNVDMAIQSVLEMIGRQFDLSRTYIFENNEKNTDCSVTFEWTNEGAQAMKAQAQNLNYEKFFTNNYLDNFNEHGVFYCQDVQALGFSYLQQLKTKSLLQSVIYDRGVFRGFIGFDKCQQDQFLTQEQIDILAFIAEILSTFLIKRQAQDQISQLSDSINALLNNQDTWLYIIRPKTFEVLYANKTLLQLVPSLIEGMTCHSVFFGHDYPCPGCPAMQIHWDCANGSAEFFNPHFKVWCQTNAVKICWKGEDAILVSSHDISKYKSSKKGFA